MVLHVALHGRSLWGASMASKPANMNTPEAMSFAERL